MIVRICCTFVQTSYVLFSGVFFFFVVCLFVCFPQQGQGSSHGTMCSMLYNDDSPPRDSIGLEMMKRVCQVNKHCACIIMWLWISKQIPGKKMIDACWFIEQVVQPMCKIFVTAEYITASCSNPSAYSSPTGKGTVLVRYRLLFPEIYICKLSSFCKKIRHKIPCQVYSLEYSLIYSSLSRALSCFLFFAHRSSCVQHSKLEFFIYFFFWQWVSLVAK